MDPKIIFLLIVASLAALRMWLNYRGESNVAIMRKLQSMSIGQTKEFRFDHEPSTREIIAILKLVSTNEKQFRFSKYDRKVEFRCEKSVLQKGEKNAMLSSD